MEHPTSWPTLKGMDSLVITATVLCSSSGQSITHWCRAQAAACPHRISKLPCRLALIQNLMHGCYMA